MSFVSVKKFDKAFIKFRKLGPKSTSAGGFLSSGTEIRNQKVEIQIDANKKVIRVRPCNNAGIKISKTGHFSCTKRILEVFGTERIYLSAGEDGWLYGKPPRSEKGGDK